MKKYAKIECGRLIVPQNYPGYIIIDGVKVYNPTEEQWISAGYLPLIESEPEEREGFIPEARYEVNEDNTEIIQTWEYIPAPNPQQSEEEEPKKTTTKRSSKK